jgi:hypothetical protein
MQIIGLILTVAAWTGGAVVGLGVLLLKIEMLLHACRRALAARRRLIREWNGDESSPGPDATEENQTSGTSHAQVNSSGAST